MNMEIGMVNQVPGTTEKLAVALSEQKEKETNNNVEIRDKIAEVKLPKLKLRKSKEDMERNELNTRIMLSKGLFTYLENIYQISKKKVKESCQF
jgi:hypothetical protein